MYKPEESILPNELSRDMNWVATEIRWPQPMMSIDGYEYLLSVYDN